MFPVSLYTFVFEFSVNTQETETDVLTIYILFIMKRIAIAKVWWIPAMGTE